MARYKLLNANGEIVNTIVADEKFVKSYCEESGSIYEEEHLPEAVGGEPTELEKLRADLDYLSVMMGVEL